jgi:hypothetical protein
MGRVGLLTLRVSPRALLRGMSLTLCAIVSVGLAARPAGAQDTAAFAAEVLTLVNKERQAVGLAPLTRAVELDRCAQKYAQYMGEAGFFSHNGPDGSTPASRIKAEGYSGTTWGENIAAGQRTPQAVMTAWMNSSGHRANILNSSFKEIGIGCAAVSGSPMGIYWVQNFGARRNAPTNPPSSPPSSPPSTTPTPAKPAISEINPGRGKVGDTVALIGSGFGSSGKVVFGGSKQGSIQGWSDTRVSVKVPTGATSGAVTVQNSGGTSNGYNFTVDTNQPEPAPTQPTQPAPTPPKGVNPSPPSRLTRPRMTRISPGSGRSGVQVTIKGQNFGTTAGRILFGTTGSASIRSWTNTEIRAVLTGTPGRRALLPVRADGVPSRNMAIFAITR